VRGRRHPAHLCKAFPEQLRRQTTPTMRNRDCLASASLTPPGGCGGVGVGSARTRPARRGPAHPQPRPRPLPHPRPRGRLSGPALRPKAPPRIPPPGSKAPPSGPAPPEAPAPPLQRLRPGSRGRRGFGRGVSSVVPALRGAAALPGSLPQSTGSLSHSPLAPPLRVWASPQTRAAASGESCPRRLSAAGRA
jgi:hypothetical protein